MSPISAVQCATIEFSRAILCSYSAAVGVLTTTAETLSVSLNVIYRPNLHTDT